MPISVITGGVFPLVPNLAQKNAEMLEKRSSTGAIQREWRGRSRVLNPNSTRFLSSLMKHAVGLQDYIFSVDQKNRCNFLHILSTFAVTVGTTTRSRTPQHVPAPLVARIRDIHPDKCSEYDLFVHDHHQDMGRFVISFCSGFYPKSQPTMFNIHHPPSRRMGRFSSKIWHSTKQA